MTNEFNPDGEYGNWQGFEAAHVFPLAYESDFISQDLSRWITNRREDSDNGINSCQNGLLLRGDIHTRFDQYGFSINVDVNPTWMRDPPKRGKEMALITIVC